MKLLSFLNQDHACYGVVQGDDVLDLTPIFGAQATDLKTFIAKSLFASAAQALQTHKPTFKLSQWSSAARHNHR